MPTRSQSWRTESHFVYMLYIFRWRDTSELLGCYKKLVEHTCQNCPGKHLSSQTDKETLRKRVFLVWGCDWMLPPGTHQQAFHRTRCWLTCSHFCTHRHSHQDVIFPLCFGQMLNKHWWWNAIVMSKTKAPGNIGCVSVNCTWGWKVLPLKYSQIVEADLPNQKNFLCTKNTILNTNVGADHRLKVH